MNLTDTREHIYITNEDRVPFKKPPLMRKDQSKRDPSRYCQYHKDIRHTTAECIHLKEEIEELIRRGHLGRYVKRERKRPENEPTSPQAQERAPEIQGEVRTIFGGPGFGGDSRRG